VDLVWVPCFRHRDLAAARRWSARRGIPLIFDPLISAYDKQIFEREKLAVEGVKARRLLEWEQRLFSCADLLLADTNAHAEFFNQTHGVPDDRIRVVPLCADEDLFRPLQRRSAQDGPLQILFFGSFIALQGPEVIIDAANTYQGPAVRWCLVGDGPLRDACRSRAKPRAQVQFEDWIRYESLPARIADADIVLGIFGGTPKAGRVVPNKLCQALACGRPLVTRATKAIPKELAGQEDTGLFLVPPANPQAIADAVATLANARGSLERHGKRANETYWRHFSSGLAAAALNSTLRDLFERRAAD
jgi:glycosyltransferase involved in cell wall biosynthesis